MASKSKISKLSQQIRASFYGKTFLATGVALEIFFYANGSLFVFVSMSTSSLKQILCIFEPFFIAMPFRSWRMFVLILPMPNLTSYSKSSPKRTERFRPPPVDLGALDCMVLLYKPLSIISKLFEASVNDLRNEEGCLAALWLIPADLDFFNDKISSSS